MGCVRDCQHPWFGGNGACVVGTDGTPACACDSGFSVLDVLGQPACESKTARTACHAVGSTLAVVCFAFAVRKLGVSLRTSFEGGGKSSGRGGGMQASSLGLYTRPRIVRLLLFASILWSVSVLVFHVIAWKTRLTLETLFPLMTFSVAWGAAGGLLSLRLWLFVLPSRLMGATSVPSVIKVWSDDRHGLAIVASCYWIWIVSCGIVGRFNSLRARMMMLGSTGPMLGLFAFVVLSVSLALSKAIRDSERSAALQQSSVLSNKGSPVVGAAATSSHGIKRWVIAWERRGVGIGRANNGEGADERGSGNSGAVGTRPKAKVKAKGGYSKTKSMLQKLTRASIAIMSAVMAIIVLGLHQGTIAHDTPLIFFMALFTIMPSIWLIISVRFLTRESSNSPAAAVTSAPSCVRSKINIPTSTGTCPVDTRLKQTPGQAIIAKRVPLKFHEKYHRVRDAPIVPV